MTFKNKPKLTRKGIPYNYPNKNCKDCFKQFKPMSNIQKFCSLTCQNRDRRKRHKEQIYAYNKMYENKHPEKVMIWKKKTTTRPEYIENKKLWEKEYRKNPEVKNKKRIRANNYYHKNIDVRIKNNIHSRINKKIKDYLKNGLIKELNEKPININLIVKNLIINLPRDYKDKKYHIDHIEPICSFDLTNEEQFKKAFAPENHQWLTAEDNMKKAREDRKKSIRLLE